MQLSPLTAVLSSTVAFMLSTPIAAGIVGETAANYKFQYPYSEVPFGAIINHEDQKYEVINGSYFNIFVIITVIPTQHFL